MKKKQRVDQEELLKLQTFYLRDPECLREAVRAAISAKDSKALKLFSKALKLFSKHFEISKIFSSEEIFQFLLPLVRSDEGYRIVECVIKLNLI